MIALPVVIVACAVAAVFDVRTRKIPNALSAVLALAAVVINASYGLRAALVCVLVMIVVLFAGLIPFSAGWFGGGDVKLLAAAAGTVNYPACLSLIVYTVLAGAIIGIAYAIISGRLRETFAGTIRLAAPLLYRGVPAVKPQSSRSIPYAVAIMAGAVVLLLSNTALPALRIPL